MWEVFLDAIVDSLKVFPFLLFIFVIIAVLEEHVDAKKHVRALGRGYGPLVCSAAGVIPQCGISVMAAKFFQEGCITVGALFAAFISVSDEAVVLLIGEGYWKEFLLITAIKFAVGCGIGYAADAVFRRRDGELAEKHGDEVEYHGCHHSGEKESAAHRYVIHPLLHCLKTFAFVLAVNVILGFVIYFVGEERFLGFMAGTGYFQPFVCALVGLIPNCAASVLIVQLFASGGINMSGLAAGLIANAGVGLALLFRNRKEIAVCLTALFTLYFAGVIVGEIVMLII